MYEIRIKLPYLTDKNPNVEPQKNDIIESASKGYIPSWCMSDGNKDNVTLVKIEEEK